MGTRADVHDALGVDIVTAGSHGDVHPFLGIGAELARRGHRVRVFVHPVFGPAVAAAGLDHVPVGGDVDYQSVLEHPDLFHPWKGSAFVFAHLIDGARRARAVLRAELSRVRPHVVLAHHTCLGVRWICEELGLPRVVAHLAPMIWFSRRDPVPPIQPAPGALWRGVARIATPLVERLLARYVDARLAALRRELGLPPERDSFRRDTFDGAASLGLWSRHFRAPQSDDPERSTTCGFVFHDDSPPMPSAATEPGASNTLGALGALEPFLASGPPPIVFSLGSAASHQPGSFYELATAACVELGVRGVLVTAAGRGTPTRLPESVRAVGYVPFSRLLPRAAAFVHHGGIGTTAQGLRAGVPALVVALAHDQFNNGVRVVELGAGRMVSKGRLTQRRLVKELARLLGEPRFRAAASRVAAGIASEDGAAAAASAVERAALTRR